MSENASDHGSVRHDRLDGRRNYSAGLGSQLLAANCWRPTVGGQGGRAAVLQSCYAIVSQLPSVLIAAALYPCRPIAARIAGRANAKVSPIRDPSHSNSADDLSKAISA